MVGRWNFLLGCPTFRGYVSSGSVTGSSKLPHFFVCLPKMHKVLKNGRLQEWRWSIYDGKWCFTFFVSLHKKDEAILTEHSSSSLGFVQLVMFYRFYHGVSQHFPPPVEKIRDFSWIQNPMTWIYPFLKQWSHQDEHALGDETAMIGVWGEKWNMTNMKTFIDTLVSSGGFASIYPPSKLRWQRIEITIFVIDTSTEMVGFPECWIPLVMATQIVEATAKCTPNSMGCNVENTWRGEWCRVGPKNQVINGVICYNSYRSRVK